jgi:hypothetical protein
MRLDKLRPSKNIEDRRCDMPIPPKHKGHKEYRELCINAPLRYEKPIHALDGLLFMSSLLLVAALRLFVDEPLDY